MITVKGIKFNFDPSPRGAPDDCGRYDCEPGTRLAPSEREARFLAQILGKPVVLIFNNREYPVFGNEDGPRAIRDILQELLNDEHHAHEEAYRRVKEIREKTEWWIQVMNALP